MHQDIIIVVGIFILVAYGMMITLNNHILDYEEYMIDVLENSFNFRKDEIENMFNNIDKNMFLLKRIIPILNNLNMI